MTSRKRIPANLKDKLLVEANHACTICGRSPVQIHHIDGNSAKNIEDNLIVLCLNHHDEAERGKTSKGLSSNLSPSALLEYKRRLQMGIFPCGLEPSPQNNVTADIKDVKGSNIVISTGDVILSQAYDTQGNRKNSETTRQASLDQQPDPESHRRFESAVEDNNLDSSHHRKLYEILVLYFDQEELKSLCFNLGVDYDDLRGEGKENKARELVTYMKRRSRIQELENEIVRERPSIPGLKKPPNHTQKPETEVRKSIFQLKQQAWQKELATLRKELEQIELEKERRSGNSFSLSPLLKREEELESRILFLELMIE